MEETETMPHTHLMRQHAQKISNVASCDQAVRNLGIDNTIFASWKRCIHERDLDPMRCPDLRVLENYELNEARSRLEGLLRLAEPALVELAKIQAGTDYAVLLTDHRGLVLQQIVEETIERQFRAAGLCLGADWGEALLGTNGIGTCIAEQRPVTVHRDEHFLSQNIGLTCSASPIHDPHGNLLAVLDSSSCSSTDSRAAQTHTLALISAYARLIESQYFLREYRNQKILRFQDRPELVTLPDKALIALSDDNRVLAANDVTLKMLDIGDRSLIVGKALNDVIGHDLQGLFDGSRKDPETVRPFRDANSGKQFFGMLYTYRKPPRRRGLVVPPTASSSDDCRGELCELRVLAGDDPQMMDAAHRARKVVDKRIPILITGETGTGKDLFSQALHRASRRKDMPFVALNCASIPESLIESELFGYKHGAFTGASREGRRGKILESNGGSLFLDEIGDMPLHLQSRLLRVLETQEVAPLGSDRTVRVELNIISATHRDLAQLVHEGSFREDLYYRLNGITISLPPLRLRRDLSDIVLKVFEAENDTGKDLRVSPEAMTTLLRYPWPGNLRQLRNVVRAAIALSEDGVVNVTDINLPKQKLQPVEPVAPSVGTAMPPCVEAESDDGGNPLYSAEQQVILATLNTHAWNISRTADALDMSRNTLYRKMRKHGITPARE